MVCCLSFEQYVQQYLNDLNDCILREISSFHQTEVQLQGANFHDLNRVAVVVLS